MLLMPVATTVICSSAGSVSAEWARGKVVAAAIATIHKLFTRISPSLDSIVQATSRQIVLWMHGYEYFDNTS